MRDYHDASETPDNASKQDPSTNLKQKGVNNEQLHPELGQNGTQSDSIEALTRHFESMAPRRVKVYLLEGEDWLDNGTGYCKGEIDGTTKKPYFIVRNELDSLDVILKLFLEGSIQFQRQQETLIVWTDLDGKDLALSFQENDGCADLCDFIIRVQQEHLSPTISLYYVLSTLYDSQGDGPREITELITGPVTYPPKSPTLSSLDEILEIISQGANSQYTRACILKFIMETGYIHQLYLLQAEAEKAQDISSLHLLSDIVKCILLYNDQTLMEKLLSSEDSILDIVGLLEYDRDLPTFKACHREYLLDDSKFRSVIDVGTPPDESGSDMNIFRKDFVLSYMKNIVLSRWMDDTTMNTIASMICSNQMDIIAYLSKLDANDHFLDRLLSLYDKELPASENLKKRRDGVMMLHQYVSVTKGQPSAQKSEFFSALIRAGLIKMVKFALEDLDSTIRSLGTDILVTVIEQDVSLVHCTHYDDNNQVDELEPPINHSHSESDAIFLQIKLRLVNDTSFTLVLCNLLLTDKSAGLKRQAYEALKTLLTSVTNDNGQDDGFMPTGPKSGRRDSEVNEINLKFLKAFYRRVASVLFQDFMYLASEGDSEKKRAVEEKARQEPMLFQHLCDLVAFCFQEHDLDLCREFFIQNQILVGVMRLIKLDFKVMLKLSALRCFKTLIFLNDDKLTTYIVKKDLLRPFVEYFETIIEDNTLANSLCLDLLEILIRRGNEKNFKTLAIHLYSNHRSFIEKITYVSTGNEIIQMVETSLNQNADPTATSIDEEENHLKDNVSSPIQGEENEGQAKLEISLLRPIEFSANKRNVGTEDASENNVMGFNGNNATKKPKLTDYLSGIKKDGELKI